jgi:hypothetical protein
MFDRLLPLEGASRWPPAPAHVSANSRDPTEKLFYSSSLSTYISSLYIPLLLCNDSRFIFQSFSVVIQCPCCSRSVCLPLTLPHILFLFLSVLFLFLSLSISSDNIPPRAWWETAGAPTASKTAASTLHGRSVKLVEDSPDKQTDRRTNRQTSKNTN